MTTSTRDVLRLLVWAGNPQLWTTAISDLTEVPLQSVQSIMTNLEKAGWATPTKETREQAPELGRCAQRTWQLTEDGYAEAQKAVEQSRQRAESRGLSLDPVGGRPRRKPT